MESLCFRGPIMKSSKLRLKAIFSMWMWLIKLEMRHIHHCHLNIVRSTYYEIEGKNNIMGTF